jgi:excisionase family DNA binding protein
MQDIVLISIPESTIRNIVEQAVRKVISENQTTTAVPADGKQLLTRKEAAELAGVCIATLDNKVKDGILKKYRTGGVVRFRRSEVIEAFSQSMFQQSGRKGNAYSRTKKS